MKVLLINGSPKGSSSNTLRLSKSFIKGLSEALKSQDESVDLIELELKSLKIGSCRGCFACWKTTPGSCVIDDDMKKVIASELEADLIIWSFPLYYYSVPGILKNLIDRQLPMSLPFMSANGDNLGSGAHDSRYDMSGKKYILISTCGFYSAEGNYDSVTKLFDHILGAGNYERIFCGQGELFRVKELSLRTDRYLSIVEKAGYEYAFSAISDATKTELEELLYPREVFEKMADASWGVVRESGEKEAFDAVFTKQMAALYDKAAFDGRDRVLEIRYTDLDKSYQIVLSREGSTVYTDKSLDPTTIIETPFEVWLSISRGKMSGEEALGRGLYRVKGDFSLMMDWDKFFFTSGSNTKKDAHEKEELSTKPNMLSMLLPWILLWIFAPIEENYAYVVSLALIGCLPLIMHKFRLIIWDKLSLSITILLLSLAVMTGKGGLFAIFGYLIFGSMWLISCLTRECLSASYVKYNYGGEKALKNPLFVKTNVILSAVWGVVYVLTATWSYILYKSGMGVLNVIINNLVPIVMLIFTNFFRKWYPAKLASGSKREK